MTVDPFGNVPKEFSKVEDSSPAGLFISTSEPALTLEESPSFSGVVTAGTEFEYIHIEELTVSHGTVVDDASAADGANVRLKVLVPYVGEAAAGRTAVLGSLAGDHGENFQLVQPINADHSTEAGVVSVAEDLPIPTKEPIGDTVQVSVSLAELEAAVVRRRRAASSSGAGSRHAQAPRVHFPGSFFTVITTQWAAEQHLT